MIRRPIHALLAAIIPGAALLLSCSTSEFPLAPPGSLEGVFVLADVDGVTLPVDSPRETDTGNGMVTEIHADTLEFLPGGRGYLISVWRRRYLSGGLVDSAHYRRMFLYERAGDALRLTFLYCNDVCRSTSSSTEGRFDSSGAFNRAYYGNWRYTRIPALVAP